MNQLQQVKALEVYSVGDIETRPWGFYEVLNFGSENNEEFCEKKIGVKPFQALSLQRHYGRREFWEVLSGELTVIHDGFVFDLKEGQSIDINIRAPHCMINKTGKPVVVYEKQMGICREEDFERLCDFGGRETCSIDEHDLVALKSI